MRDSETGGFLPNEPIRIRDLTDADKGRSVFYCHPHGATEPGVLSSWNDRWIFCRFGQGSTAMACNPKHLSWGDGQ